MGLLTALLRKMTSKTVEGLLSPYPHPEIVTTQEAALLVPAIPRSLCPYHSDPCPGLSPQSPQGCWKGLRFGTKAYWGVEVIFSSTVPVLGHVASCSDPACVWE